MIRIRVTETDGRITAMHVSGHAEAAPYGKDLVCAAVSGIVFGLCNALDQIAGIETISVTDNTVTISVDHPDDLSETIMRTGLIQLKTVGEKNQNYIKITEV